MAGSRTREQEPKTNQIHTGEGHQNPQLTTQLFLTPVFQSGLNCAYVVWLAPSVQHSALYLPHLYTSYDLATLYSSDLFSQIDAIQLVDLHSCIQ